MNKLKVYLDTSVINFLFADDSPEKKKITEEFFNDYVAKGKIETYISDVVIREIRKTYDENKRIQLQNIILEYELKAFNLTKEEENLSQLYILEGIIPKKKEEDANHLAIATVNEMDALISWNFKHLANINKEKLINIVNVREGYKFPLRLITPLEVMDE